MPASTGQEVFQIEKVASTDRLGRLISLAGSAIDLARENKRSAEEIDALLDTLQRFKDPNMIYPHYNNPERPHFGPDQVRCLHQLRPGLKLVEKNSNYRFAPLVVVSYPKQRMKDDWFITVSYSGGDTTEISLQDMNITPYPVRGWSSATWLSFQDKPTPCNKLDHSC